jgi:hypothetical protein
MVLKRAMACGGIIRILFGEYFWEILLRKVSQKIRNTLGNTFEKSIAKNT